MSKPDNIFEMDDASEDPDYVVFLFNSIYRTNTAVENNYFIILCKFRNYMFISVFRCFSEMNIPTSVTVIYNNTLIFYYFVSSRSSG